MRRTFIKLGEAGIHGNGYMLMLEKNSDEIAKLLACWLSRSAKRCMPSIRSFLGVRYPGIRVSPDSLRFVRT